MNNSRLAGELVRMSIPRKYAGIGPIREAWESGKQEKIRKLREPNQLGKLGWLEKLGLLEGLEIIGGLRRLGGPGKLEKMGKLERLGVLSGQRGLRNFLRLLLILVLEFSIMLTAYPGKPASPAQNTYALSGENYQNYLLLDESWPYDNTSLARLFQLVRGDAGVDQETLIALGNIIQSEAANTVYTTTKLQFNSPLYLFIDSDKNAYTKDLKNHFTASKLTNEVNESVAIQFNDHIYFPIYKFADDSTDGDITNTLAHELTHAVLYQNNIEAKLPIWMNEGFAWYVGNQAEKKIAPQAEAQTDWEIQETILYEAKEHKLYTLDQSNTMFTNHEPKYNMEWEDYLAVRELIQQYGLSRFQSFLLCLQSAPLETAFQKTYGMPITSFEQSFYQKEINLGR